jgi:hypothetical protein
MRLGWLIRLGTPFGTSRSVCKGSRTKRTLKSLCRLFDDLYDAAGGAWGGRCHRLIMATRRLGCLDQRTPVLPQKSPSNLLSSLWGHRGGRCVTSHHAVPNQTPSASADPSPNQLQVLMADSVLESCEAYISDTHIEVGEDVHLLRNRFLYIEQETLHTSRMDLETRRQTSRSYFEGLEDKVRRSAFHNCGW